jgi:hypothetical protein
MVVTIIWQQVLLVPVGGKHLTVVSLLRSTAAKAGSVRGVAGLRGRIWMLRMLQVTIVNDVRSNLRFYGNVWCSCIE